MSVLGDQLRDLCALGQREIVLVAPFIKVNALRRLVEVIPLHVPLHCVTRWRPEEVAAGISDVEVWPLLRERPLTFLSLRSDLHAKYYRIDNRCLIGSANLTGAALGWSSSPNLELLITAHVSDPILQAFDQELFAALVPVDNDLYERMQQAAAKISILPRQTAFEDSVSVNLEVNVSPPFSPCNWLPNLRNPDDLYLAYTGRKTELIATARISAQQDLYVLDPPPGLSLSAFETYIGTMLLQQVLVYRVDSFLANPRRFGAVRDFLGTLPCASEPGFDAERAWQTLMRWLRYFLPGRYVTIPSRHSEVFQRTI